ncbi:hypothetical protein BYT27DRAFT_7343767 [Phlegmacium glaucopus]|nr:hypothetical protein BYT27DRAFT_7343767 [Phlegmacium glaucopus]
MFFATPLIGAVALLSGFTAALPRPHPDSALGEEVAVSAPNGIIMSDTAALATQTAVTQSNSAASTMATSVDSSSGSTASAALATATSSTWTSSSSSGSGSSNQGGSGWGSSQAWNAPPALPTDASSSWSSSSPPPTYGSGSSNWGNQNYNSCVQQCVASFGGPAATYTPPTATSVSSSGSGATHTVIVAPTMGVLRFVPFALNASVGDTIKFMWGADNHTVTKSSSLTPCNKTADMPFGSGEQNKGFVFTQVVNDTNPTFFYCGTPTHCEKGMFGIINPPNALGSPNSASAMMPPLIQNNSDIAAYASYTSSMTNGIPAAAGWGGSIDMSALPPWSHTYAAENIMYTRAFLAANKEVLQQDGTVNLGSAANGSTPLMLPKDLSAALNSTGATSSATSPVSPLSSSVPSASSPESSLGSSSSSTSAAISTSSSKALLVLVVGFATLMML